MEEGIAEEQDSLMIQLIKKLKITMFINQVQHLARLHKKIILDKAIQINQASTTHSSHSK